MTDKGSVRGVEVLGDPGKLRTAAIVAAVKFANTKKYIDPTTWPLINVFVWFPQQGHRAPLVVQVVPGAVGCVSTPLRVRVSSLVMVCRLLDHVEPIYPAGTQNIEDRLTLAVLVGKDGNVLNARKVSGPDNLVPAAVEAVRKWKYRPYLLNGEPIEVDTTVDLPTGASSCGGALPSGLFSTRPAIPVLATEGTNT